MPRISHTTFSLFLFSPTIEGFAERGFYIYLYLDSLKSQEVSILTNKIALAIGTLVFPGLSYLFVLLGYDHVLIAISLQGSMLTLVSTIISTLLTQ